jgi:hypothetical protein
MKTEQSGAISIVRRGDAPDTHPVGLLVGGERARRGRQREILIDLTPVTYVDESATIGCLMDYQQVHGRRTSEAVRRPEARRNAHDDRRTELHQIHADEPTAVKSWGIAHAHHQNDDGAMIPLDGDLLAIMETLYAGSDREARAGALMRGHGQGDPPSHQQMDDSERHTTSPRACSSTR